MFTINIRHIIQAGMGVKWELDAPEQATALIKEIQESQFDGAEREKLDKLVTDNEKDRTVIINQVRAAIRDPKTSDGDKKDFISLLEKWDKELMQADMIHQMNAANFRINTREKRDSSNNLPVQAADLRDVVIMLQASEKISKDESDATKALLEVIGKNGKWLEDTNLPSLLRHMIGKEIGGYASDYTKGPWETSQYKKMETAYKTNEAVFKKVFELIVPSYNALQTPKDLAKTIIDTQPGNITEYTKDLAGTKKFFAEALPTTVQDKKDRGQNSFMTQKDFDEHLGDLDETQFLARMKKLLIPGGKESSGITNIADLRSQMKSDITLRAAFVKGANEVALMNENIEFYDKWTLESSNDAMKQVLENKAKIMDYLEKSLKDAQSKAVAQLGLESNISPEEKAKKTAAINEAFDMAYTELNKPERWKTISTGLALAITNQNKGAMASQTRNMDMLLADTVTMAAGLGTDKDGKYRFGIGIDFSKNLYEKRDVKVDLHYGAFNLVPFVGAQLNDEDLSFGFTGSLVGYNVNVGMKTGENQVKEAIYRDIAKHIEDKLGEYAQLGTKSTDIKLKLEEINKPYFDKLSPEQQKIEQEYYDRISTELGNKLALTNFDQLVEARVEDTDVPRQNEETILKRFALLKLHLGNTIQSIVAQENIERKNMGMGVKEVGVTAGILGTVQYILPYVSASQTEININQAKRKIERTKTLDTSTLFESPVFEENGSYSLEFKELASGISEKNISLPEWATLHRSINREDDSENEALSIIWLKDYAIKVELKDGKYAITYDDKKKIEKTGAVSDASIDNTLKKVTSIRGALDEPKIRTQLSGLMVPKSQKWVAMNDWAKAMDAFERDNKGNITDLAKQLSNILSSRFKDTNNKSVRMNGLKKLNDILSKIPTDKPLELQSALFDIRWASMMDQSQASRGIKFNQPHNPENKNETITRVRWGNMLASPKFKWLPGIQNLQEDYVDVVPPTYKQAGNKIWGIETGMIGAVASLKTDPAMMSLMPAGTMRIATDKDGNKFSTSINDPVKQNSIFATVLPEDSRSAVNLQKDTATKLGLKEPVSYQDLTSLLLNGKATIGWREVSMSGTQFILCAYGDCTNPAMGIIPGKLNAWARITINGQDASSSITTGIEKTAKIVSTGANVATSSIGLTGLGGNSHDTASKTEQVTPVKAPTTPDSPTTPPPTPAPNIPVPDAF